MKKKISMAAAALALSVCAGAYGTQAQQTEAADLTPQEGARAAESGGTRVALAEQSVAFDAQGRAALGGRLRTTELRGTPDAPERNSRVVIENRSATLFTYTSGWATFYDATGVRCGEGLWKLAALAPGESAEVDTPGLRLTCTPSTWRIIATSLLSRTGDLASPSTQPATPPQDAAPAAAALSTSAVAPLPPLEININGKTLPIQPGNPLEITVGRERVRITVNTAP